MPWSGKSVFDDPFGDPSDQTEIMVGDRLSEYVFHLIAHVNSKGLPEYADVELREAVQRASAWNSAQEHARRCCVCRSKATDIAATAGSGPTDTGVSGSAALSHSLPTGSGLGVIYPECSHSSSERSGGGGWSGGDVGGVGGGGGGFDGGGGGFGGGGGADCGGSSSW